MPTVDVVSVISLLIDYGDTMCIAQSMEGTYRKVRLLCTSVCILLITTVIGEGVFVMLICI